jgi:serine/threonine protein phosphatase PrpC
VAELSITKTTTSSLECVGDTGALAINAVGFLEGSSFLFNSVVLPHSPGVIGESLRTVFKLLTSRSIGGLGNLDDEVSIVYRLNNEIGVIGRGLTYDQVPLGRGVVYNIYIAGGFTRVGNIYINVRNIISPFIGYAGSIKGLKANKVANDDSILLMGISYCYGSRVNRVLIGVVADGVTSLGRGYYASSEAIKFFTEGITRYVYLEGDLTPEAVHGIYRETAEYVLKLNLANNSSTATTFTAIVYPVIGRAIFVHVGDTRVYYYSGGELRRLTQDDKVEGTSALTKAIGIRVDEPSMGSIDFSVGDALTFLSDGVYNVVSENEIREILGKTKNPYTVVRSILSMCESRRVRDDASIGVVKRLM